MKRIVWAVVPVLGLAASAQADTFWMTGNNGKALYKVDTSTAAATLVGSSLIPSDFYGAAFGPDGALYGMVIPSTLTTVNQTNGQNTAIGSGGVSAYCLEIDSAGKFFTVDTDGVLDGVNPTTGAITTIGASNVNAMDLAFDGQGVLWAVDQVGGLFTIDTSTGAATPQKQITGAYKIWGIAFAADGTLYATNYASNSELYKIDLTSGAASEVGDTGIFYAMGGDIYNATAVPLPGAVWAGMSLLAGLGVWTVRRNQQARAC